MKIDKEALIQNGKSFVKRFFASERFVKALVLFLGLAAIVLLCMAAITPVRYDLRLGMVPNVTIAATKDVVDEVNTELKRKNAADAVIPSYTFKEGVTEEVMNSFNNVFNQLRTVYAYGNTLENQSATRKYTTEETQYARGLLTDINLQSYQITALLHSTQEEVDEAYTLLSTALQSTMINHVTEGQESNAISGIMQIVSYRMSISWSQYLARPILTACIKPNMIIDQTATERARAAAAEAVDSIIFKQGQNIVVKGEGMINASQLAMVKALGLLNDGEVDERMYLGAIGLITVIVALSFAVLRQDRYGVFGKVSYIILIYVIILLTLALAILARQLNMYLSPTLLCVILISVLLGTAPALIVNITVALIISVLMAGGNEAYAEKMVGMLVTTLVSGTFAALFLHAKCNRLRVLLTGLITGGMNWLAINALGVMTQVEASGYAQNGLYSACSACLAALLAIALHPLLESIFRLPTPTKLMELCNPNSPLLRKMQMKAPGTYHHSIIVANLSEAAAESIGANALLARVGAYYHDIGKINKPEYFTENQHGENAHDNLLPISSAQIITAHVTDGVELARAERIPQAVIEIIAQHHGDTPVAYFYSKAVERYGQELVNIEDYRYKGVSPTTKEAAIVMLCDTLEAAVRALKNPSGEEIRQFISKLIRDKMDDGQLNNSPLTYSDLNRICAAVTTVFSGVYHKRIEYPEIKQNVIHHIGSAKRNKAAADGHAEAKK